MKKIITLILFMLFIYSPVYAKDVLYFYSITQNNLVNLLRVCESSIVTHIIVFASHPNDWDFATAFSGEGDDAVTMVLAHSKIPIIMRCLWPVDVLGTFDYTKLWSSQYYIDQINAVKTLANSYGALSGLDTEVYGVSGAQIDSYIATPNDFTEQQLSDFNSALSAAIVSSGKVDYILPGGYRTDEHPYNNLSALGTNRITEETYYNSELAWSRVDYSPNIAGIYINTVTTGGAADYFTPIGTFETYMSYWYSDYDGIMLYPLETNLNAATYAIYKYSVDRHKGSNVVSGILQSYTH